MARQPRIEYEGAFYHITSRGNLRERVFSKDMKRTQKEYRKFVRSGIGDSRNPLEGVRAGIVLGEEPFITKIKGLIQGEKQDPGIDRELPSLRKLYREKPKEDVVKVV